MPREVLCRSARRRWSRQGRALGLGPSKTRGRRSRQRLVVVVVVVVVYQPLWYRYYCRDRSTMRVCIPLQANAPRPLAFHFLCREPRERASDFLACLPRPVSSSLPLILSSTAPSSVAPSIAAELRRALPDPNALTISQLSRSLILLPWETPARRDSAAISRPRARCERKERRARVLRTRRVAMRRDRDRKPARKREKDQGRENEREKSGTRGS